MSFSVRSGRFDVIVVAGPGVAQWPSPGVCSLSSLCAEAGLEVGLFGNDTVEAKGVIPLPGTGGLMLAEDTQHRIHRLEGRAIVRVSPAPFLPDVFDGWYSPGLVPLSTAERLKKESKVSWNHPVAVLGTGNKALRFASSLLESGTPEVYCIETFIGWGAKRFSGWEVERRRFEIAGGRVIEGVPLRLTPKAALVWELVVGPLGGPRAAGHGSAWNEAVLEVGRVVSAGPFADLGGVREHPPGAFLFEFEQTAGLTPEDDIEGWTLEEDRGRWLAGKIVKALATDLGPRREKLEKVFSQARARLKRFYRHREAPFTPSYQGKWIGAEDGRKIRVFQGTPQQLHKKKTVASVECFEDICCELCQRACQHGGIRFSRGKSQILVEGSCLACGACIAACPSGAVVLIQEKDDAQSALLTVPWRGKRKWKEHETASLLNRRGEVLASGRVTGVFEGLGGVQLVTLQVPSHLAWEARGLKRPPAGGAVDESYLESLAKEAVADPKVEITLDGDKRLVRDRVPISIALFETGRNRPEDMLLCRDGSCGLCGVLVDGIKKPACKTEVHRGMALRLGAVGDPGGGGKTASSGALCVCKGTTREEVIERVRQGDLQSAEAVLSTTHVGKGKCHGQLCGEALKRLLADEGLDVSQWIDWRFPWSEWKLNPAPHE